MADNSPFTAMLQLFVILHIKMNQLQQGKAALLNLESLFITEITNIGFRAKHVDAVRAYFKRGKGELDFNFNPTEEDMKAIVFKAYELLCNSIGPVATDELFGDAIRRVEKTSAGMRYSPKKFF